nr:hypothetical protein [Armatimonadota bacterium]
TPSPHALAIWAQWSLETMPVNVIRGVTDKQPPEFRKVLEDRSGMRKNEDAWNVLSNLPPAQIINMVVECRIRERMARALDGGGSGNPMVDWLLQQPRAGSRTGQMESDLPESSFVTERMNGTIERLTKERDTERAHVATLQRANQETSAEHSRLITESVRLQMQRKRLENSLRLLYLRQFDGLEDGAPYILVCSGCSKTQEGIYGQANEGWGTLDGDTDLCPECLAKQGGKPVPARLAIPKKEVGKFLKELDDDYYREQPTITDEPAATPSKPEDGDNRLEPIITTYGLDDNGETVEL